MFWMNEKTLLPLLSAVLKNPHSDFYRDKYDRAGLSATAPSAKLFTRLPFLTREELSITLIERRLYVPKEEVRFVAFTSGTSSKSPLLIAFADVNRYYFEPSLGLPVSRPLVIHPPLLKSFSHTFIQQCREAEHPLNPLLGDVQNLANSALVAAAVGCDSIYAIPTLAELFAPHAEERGIAKDIKLLALSSETLTSARREQLKQAYPNALIANLYGSAELGQLPLFPCRNIMKREENSFHILVDALAAVEIVEGELVVTYGLNRATPLIRYRTRDYFEEAKEGCDCSLPGPILRWSHRSNVDRMRINGVEFDVEGADRAFSKLTFLRNAPYQVHFRQGSGSAVDIVVEFADPKLAADPVSSRVLMQRAESELPDAWRISSTATLRTALTKGFFSSLSVIAVPRLSVEGTKSMRFINHVE